MFQSLYIVILLGIWWKICETKYTISDGLSSTNSVSEWKDVFKNAKILYCYKNIGKQCVGTEKSESSIHWEINYNLNQFSKVDIYIEYQVSGVWNDQFLQVWANDAMIYKKLISLVDINRSCNQNFLYESYVYIVDLLQANYLKLEIKTTKPNQGLYIQKIILNSRRQDGRNTIIPFLNYIPQCRIGSRLEFVQYYCKCTKSLVYQVDTCKDSCEANYLYDSSTNECYKKQNCDQCIGLNTDLKCNTGFYKYNGNGSYNSDCLKSCPGDYYSDSSTMTCISMKNYLQSNENNGYIVDHHFFYKETADFFHFFQYNEIFIQVNSMPRKVQERSFIYHQDKFVAGSYETFQSQQLYLTIRVKFPQYKLRFIAVGHFIDFIPSKLDISINGVQQSIGQYIKSTVNEEKVDQDYLLNFDFSWTRNEVNPLAYNQIILTIEQPLINGGYQGYFYLDDINIYTFRCKTECTSCFTINYCSPCTNPSNKNQDCSCKKGYYLQGDICKACSSICSSCVELGKCIECKSTTHRINPPLCNTCSDQYFLSVGNDDCQPCISGCKKCTTADTCQYCLIGYFKNVNGKCVSDCDDGFFQDSSSNDNPLCSKCSDNCLKCQYQSSICTQCANEFTLVNNHCYYCPKGQYLQGTICLTCIQNCQICKSQICTQCSDTYFYQSETNQCVKDCNQNQFANQLTQTCDLCDSSCLSCNNNTAYDCLSCPSGNFLNIVNGQNGKCEPNCLIGYYRQDYYCEKCWIGCYSCSDSTQQCNVCEKKYYRFQENQFCYEFCPDGYYNNDQGQICSKCNQICKTCNESQDNNCLSCFSPLSLYSNQCIKSCPDGYASNNGQCEVCPLHCELCLVVNKCSKCKDAYFLYQNECYFQCPISYTPDRETNTCKCKYDNCMECNLQEFFYNNDCLDKCPTNTFTVSSICYECNEICLTCFGGQINECNSCQSPLKLFNNQCVPECLGSFYHEEQGNQCSPCNETCQRCKGPNENDCTVCYSPQILTTRGTCKNECFSDEYLILQERQCNKCHPECLTCFSDSNQSCLKCRNYFYQFTCIDICPGNTTLNSCEQTQVNVITQCSYQCQTCELSPRYCKQCIGNRINNPPICDCEQGYFDNGYDSNCQECSNQCFSCIKYSDNCLLCKGDRLKPQCYCPKYYYDDGISMNCIKCEDNCEICSNQGCITCLTNRINPPLCICPDGYYEAFQLFCLKCNPQCSTCLQSNQFCQTCSDIRENPPICNCPKGYFEDQYLQCMKCHPTCKECNIDGCTSCFGNRIGPSDGQCTCEINRQKIGSLFCTDCQLGIPYFELNDELDGFFYDFGGQIIIEEGNQCNQIFENETLQLLGSNPICDEKSVLFGKDPTIKIGDQLKLKTNLILIGCEQRFESIMINSLQLPIAFDPHKHKPQIQFKQQLFPNVCSPIKISFYQQKFDGNRKLEIVEWKMVRPLYINPEIQKIIDDNTKSGKELIVFPPKTLISATQYVLELTLQNFVGLQNTFWLQFTTTAHPGIVVSQLDQDNHFKRFQEISLTFILQYFYCFQKASENSILSYNISLNNTFIQNGSFAVGFEDGEKHQVLLQFKPYYFNIPNKYVLEFQTNLQGLYGEVESYDEFEFFIISSIPYMEIQGGNQTISYHDGFNLNASIIDKDELSNYTCYWDCLDIANETSCQDIFQVYITFNNDCQQRIKGKTFAPYQQLRFTVSIVKHGVSYQAQSYIQIIEFTVQSLDVKGVDQNREQNYQNELIYELNYPEVNHDDLYYACEIIYQQSIQASFAFYYPKLKMKLLDYFSNLQEEFGQIVKIRLSIYEPKYVMPSINTQIIKVQIPQQNCEFKLEKVIVEFLDNIQLLVNCSSLNLQYSIHLYPNQTAYRDAIIKSNFYDMLLISPLQQSNNISFNLPHLSKQEHILIIQIQNSQKGIKNYTVSVNVRKFDNINQQNFKDFLKKQETFDQQLIGYRIVAERLSLIGNLQELKESLYLKLIYKDENQTLLSNQTEILYHSIALMAVQNISLIPLNESHLLTQLFTRVKTAGLELKILFSFQKQNQMTSQQLFQMQDYINQCYSFLTLYLAIAEYRVSQNISAKDVLIQIENLIEFLQNTMIANQPLVHFETPFANFKFGCLTSKLLTQTIGTQVGGDERNSQTLIYKFSITKFKHNPFYESEKLLRFSSIQPKINVNRTHLLLKPIKYKFAVESNKTLKCISQINKHDWSSQICKTNQTYNHVICQCKYLFPTTLIEIEEQEDEIYSPPTEKQFQFQSTRIFKFYTSITGVFFVLPVISIFFKILLDKCSSESINKFKAILSIGYFHSTFQLLFQVDNFLAQFLRGIIIYTSTIRSFLVIFIFGIPDGRFLQIVYFVGLFLWIKIDYVILKTLIQGKTIISLFFGVTFLIGQAEVVSYIFWSEILLNSDCDQGLIRPFLIVFLGDNILSLIILTICFCLYRGQSKWLLEMFKKSLNEKEIIYLRKLQIIQ